MLMVGDKMFVYACEVFRWKRRMSFLRQKCYDEYACQIRMEDTIQKWIDYYHSSQFSTDYEIRDDELSNETGNDKLHRTVLIKKKKNRDKDDYAVIVITITRYEIIN